MAGKEETGVASKGGQPEGTAAPEKGAGVQEGVPAEGATAEFDFASVRKEAWESGAWYEHVPQEAVNLDKFPQFGESGEQAEGVRIATGVGHVRFHDSG